MRLIDVDKLPVTCNVAIVNGKLELNGWIAVKIIDEAPTVKAIPIEWLKYHVIGRKDLTFDKLELIWSIIKDWERENGNIQDK